MRRSIGIRISYLFSVQQCNIYIYRDQSSQIIRRSVRLFCCCLPLLHSICFHQYRNNVSKLIKSSKPGTRWAPTSYERVYNPYKWSYKPALIGRGPFCGRIYSPISFRKIRRKRRAIAHKLRRDFNDGHLRGPISPNATFPQEIRP